MGDADEQGDTGGFLIVVKFGGKQILKIQKKLWLFRLKFGIIFLLCL